MNRVLSHALRKALLASCCLVPVVAAPTVWAQDPPAARERTRFDIPAQSLDSALTALAQQGSREIVIATDTVRGRFSQELHGDYTLDEALNALLQDMDLRHRVNESGTIVIEGAARRTNAESSSDRARDLPTITVRKPFTDANVDIVRTEDDPQPYYIFSGDEIVQSNAANLEDFIRQRLTMDASRYTASQRNVYGGVNLRGLGTNQTLVLVNGRRIASHLRFEFDINAFPPSMIDRVEVLPSSAAAIYGGSAVGGVFNIILKRDFEGGDVRFTYDTPLDKHAPNRSLSAAYGWMLEDGRTNITLSGSYSDNDPLTWGDRPQLFQRGISRILERAPRRLYGAWPFMLGTTPNIASANGSNLSFKDGTSLGSPLTYISPGMAPDTPASQLQADLLGNAGKQNTTVPRIPGQAVTYGLDSAYGYVSEAVSVSGAIRRRMTDRLELIAEAYYSSNEPKSWTPFSDSFGYVPASAPTSPFQQDVYISIPVGQENPRIQHMDSLRFVAGFVLDLPNDWRAQGDYTWNRLEYGIDTNNVRLLGDAYADGTVNPFVDSMVYLDFATNNTDPYKEFQSSKLTDIGLRMSGPVGRLPAGAPNLTVGLGYRQESLLGGYTFFGGQYLQTLVPQSQDVASLYAEALIPLIGPGNGVPLVRQLDLQIASRIESFSVSSGTASYRSFPPDYVPDPNLQLVRGKVDYSSTNTTVGLSYMPVEAVTLRASYATAFLPATFGTLVPGVVNPVGQTFGVDPRRGNESFVLIGGSVSGGNPDLKPMEATTWNVGLIFEPTSWKGLRLGVEWFRIERENLIFSPTLPQLLANESSFPGRVVRAAPEPGDPYGVGRITFLDLTALNAKQVSTEGFDFSVGYRKSTERHGNFSFDLLSTVIDSFTRQLSLSGNEEEIVGWIGQNGPLKARANATLGWEYGNWSLGWTAHYYGSYDQVTSVRLNGTFEDIITAQGGTTVPHQIYHNLQAGYRFPSAGEAEGWKAAFSGVSVALGIRNVLKTTPPFDAGEDLIGYYSPFGDPRLRSMQLSVSKRF